MESYEASVLGASLTEGEAERPSDIEGRCGGIIRLPEGHLRILASDDCEALYDAVHRHAVERDYTKLDLPACIKLAREQLTPGTFPHLLEIVEKSVFVVASTFGADEPSYLEALGSERILQLRAKKNPKFLLLGSLGKYSAREFSRYARSINQGASSYVIEKNEICLEPALQDDAASRNLFLRGDARAMPIAPNSIDHICSNHLFHFLQFLRGRHDIAVENITRVLEESFHALVPGGVFLLVEQRYGNFKSDQNLSIEQMREEVSHMAARCGFAVSAENRSLSFTLTQEVGRCSVDEGGVPRYGDALLFDDLHDVVVMRLEKPR